ncbi:hypothetical protein AC1031_016983 [Aphanomyces cochlioides]|nr:hypothetical protein AC1031_016983 [Aphanomyces cochlioides]
MHAMYASNMEPNQSVSIQAATPMSAVKAFAANMENICQVDGCTKVAHARRLCVRHGGGQKCKITECSKIARSKGFCYHHGGLPSVQSTTTSDVEDQDMFACILGNVTEVDMTNIDDLLAASCNCDLEFTVEEHEMLDYFIMA